MDSFKITQKWYSVGVHPFPLCSIGNLPCGQVANKDATLTESVHKSRADRVMGSWTGDGGVCGISCVMCVSVLKRGQFC